MIEKGDVLVIAKSMNTSLALQLILIKKLSIDYAQTIEEGLEKLKKNNSFRLVILEQNRKEDELYFLSKLEIGFPDMPVILSVTKKESSKLLANHPIIKDVIDGPILDEAMLKRKVYGVLGING